MLENPSSHFRSARSRPSQTPLPQASTRRRAGMYMCEDVLRRSTLSDLLLPSYPGRSNAFTSSLCRPLAHGSRTPPSGIGDGPNCPPAPIITPRKHRTNSAHSFHRRVALARATSQTIHRSQSMRYSPREVTLRCDGRTRRHFPEDSLLGVSTAIQGPKSPRRVQT